MSLNRNFFVVITTLRTITTNMHITFFAPY